MTYEQALDWCIANVPMTTFDSFDDWYEQCTSELATEELTDNDKFRSMMESAYYRFVPEDRERDFIEQDTQEAEDFEREQAEPITYNVPVEREIKLPPSGRSPIILSPKREIPTAKGAPLRVEPTPTPQAPPQAPQAPEPKRDNVFSRFFSKLAQRFRR